MLLFGPAGAGVADQVVRRVGLLDQNLLRTGLNLFFFVSVPTTADEDAVVSTINIVVELGTAHLALVPETVVYTGRSS